MIKNHIPKSWESICLGNITHITYGKGLPTKHLLSSGFPVFGANGIIGFYDRYLYEDSQLLISCRGASSGEINFSPPKCFVTNNSLIVDFPFQAKILRKTFYYFLQAVKKDRLVTGSAQPQVTINNAIELKLNLPPLNEQKRIVAKIEELFSELDNGITALKTAREQLKVYRQAVLKHAFEGKLTAKWREENADKLESPEQLLAHIQQEREARYQEQLEDWETVVKEWEANGKEGKKPCKPKSLKDFGEFQEDELIKLPTLADSWVWKKLGFLTTGVEYGTSAKSSETGSTPVIRMGNLQNGHIDWSDLVYTSDPNEIEKYSLRKNDLLFNRTNSPELVGKTAKYKGEKPALFAGYLIRINQIETIALSDYINYFLNSHIAKQHGNSVKTDGVNQSNINGEKLQNYPFPFCSIAEQSVIVNMLEKKLSLTDASIRDIELQLSKAETLRQSILKKAFSGQLVPQDPTDEPASELLARIQAEKEFVNTLKTKKTNKKQSVSGH